MGAGHTCRQQMDLCPYGRRQRMELRPNHASDPAYRADIGDTTGNFRLAFLNPTQCCPDPNTSLIAIKKTRSPQVALSVMDDIGRISPISGTITLFIMIEVTVIFVLLIIIYINVDGLSDAPQLLNWSIGEFLSVWVIIIIVSPLIFTGLIVVIDKFSPPSKVSLIRWIATLVLSYCMGFVIVEYFAVNMPELFLYRLGQIYHDMYFDSS